jgi:hypothetical protein
MLVLVGGLLLAILTEVGQGLPFIDRQTDITDAVADTIGVALGIALFRWIEILGRPRAVAVESPEAG